MINPSIIILADSGYQGIQSVRNAVIPIKKSKNNKLCADKKNS